MRKFYDSHSGQDQKIAHSDSDFMLDKMDTVESVQIPSILVKMVNLHMWSIVYRGVAIFASLWLLVAASKLGPSDCQCVRHLSAWSPLLDIVKLEWTTYENPFILQSVFNGSPTEALESAWASLITERPISVPFSRLKDLDISTEHDWATSANDETQILAVPEIFIQLECLNYLRQQTYAKEYDYSHLPGFQGSSNVIMSRIDGCIQRLRHAILCDADVTPWILTIQPGTNSPDLNTLHYCRNFDGILEASNTMSSSGSSLRSQWFAGPV